LHAPIQPSSEAMQSDLRRRVRVLVQLELLLHSGYKEVTPFGNLSSQKLHFLPASLQFHLQNFFLVIFKDLGTNSSVSRKFYSERTQYLHILLLPRKNDSKFPVCLYFYA
jgi:hypothetical protein